MLAYGLWHDYAEAFTSVTGNLPRYAPTSGDYYQVRTWAEYSVSLSDMRLKPRAVGG